jgi:hypothetical protein
MICIFKMQEQSNPWPWWRGDRGLIQDLRGPWMGMIGSPVKRISPVNLNRLHL